MYQHGNAKRPRIPPRSHHRNPKTQAKTRKIPVRLHRPAERPNLPTQARPKIQKAKVHRKSEISRTKIHPALRRKDA